MSKLGVSAKRFLSGFMALVILFSLLPATLTIPAKAETADSVVLDHVDYGGTAHSYTSTNSALGQVWFHDFVMQDPSGNLYDGFCMDHTAKLNNGQKGHTWTYGQTYAKESADNPGFMPRVFLDWFFYSADADGWDDWTKRCIQAWVQTIIWMWQAGQITSYDDEEVIERIARERVNVFESYGTPGQSMEGATYITKLIIEDWRNGVVPTYAYSVYDYAGTSNNIQPVLIQEPETVEEYAGWLKISKQNSSGENLPGATFTIYQDSACNYSIKAVTTTAAQWASTQLDFQYNAPQTFYVKETSAPVGYQPIDTVFSVTVDPAVNNSEASAAAVNGGSPIINEKNVHSGGSEGLIKKIDQDGNPLPGALFRLTPVVDGKAGPSRTTDANGTIDFQWMDVAQDNYIAPGHYLVEEIEPPAGYVMGERYYDLLTLY